MPTWGVCDGPVAAMYLQADGEQAFPGSSPRNTHALLRFRCDRRAWVKLRKFAGAPDKEAAWDVWCPVCSPDVAVPAGCVVLVVEEAGTWGPYTMLAASCREGGAR